MIVILSPTKFQSGLPATYPISENAHPFKPLGTLKYLHETGSPGLVIHLSFQGLHSWHVNILGLWLMTKKCVPDLRGRTIQGSSCIEKKDKLNYRVVHKKHIKTGNVKR